MARRVEITLDEETWERFELARGHEPRASFVKRALEWSLEGEQPATRHVAPASSRASAVTFPSATSDPSIMMPKPSETSDLERKALKNFSESIEPASRAAAFRAASQKGKS